MEAAGSNCGDPCCQQDYVCLIVCREHGAPPPKCSGIHIGVATSHEYGEDVERDKAGVGNESKEVVAGGASGWSRLGITD